MANTNLASFPYAAPSDAVLSVASDNAATTLSDDVDSLVTTIPVIDNSSFAVPSLIVIENEIILAQSFGVDSFTNCVRGFAGTTNAAHNSGAAISGFIVAYHHNQVAVEIESIGSYIFDSDLSGFKTSQNMFSYSEDFTQTYWSKSSGVSVSPGSDYLPNGSPGTIMLEGTSSGLNKISAVPIGLVDGNTYTFSVYAKYNGTATWIVIGQRLDGPEGNYAWFNLMSDGTGVRGNVGSGAKAAMVPIGLTGWYRCMVVVESSTTNAYKAFDIGIAPGNGISASYIGYSINAIELSGAQVQAGDLSGPMSYIITKGTTFSLTGSGDLILDEGDLS
jgi:hypothetical protein